MPYKNKIQQKEAQRRHYLLNKDKYRNSVRENRNETKAWFKTIKSTKICTSCGESNYFCLDFHHKNPNEKRFNITDAVKFGYSKDTILLEMDKCDILCTNCHRKLHSKNRGATGNYFRKHIGKNIDWLRTFKSDLFCVDCGIKDESFLDFHHIGVDKYETVCRLVSKGCSVRKLLEEISKCEVLCANCHRKRHNGNVWEKDSNK